MLDFYKVFKKRLKITEEEAIDLIKKKYIENMDNHNFFIYSCTGDKEIFDEIGCITVNNVKDYCNLHGSCFDCLVLKEKLSRKNCLECKHYDKNKKDLSSIKKFKY